MLSLISLLIIPEAISASNKYYYPPRPTPRPTPQPTPRPTSNPTPEPVEIGGGGIPPVGPNDECEYDVNYYFEGIPCQISGDPHFITFNGANHDFMGQPDKELDGSPIDQFYYVTQCFESASSLDKMPFRILGRQYNLWPSVSGLDYLVIELFADGGDYATDATYNLFLSPDFVAYARIGDRGVSTYYDDIPSGSLTNINCDGYSVNIGSRFRVTVDETGSDFNTVNLKLEIDGSYINEISISCQSKDDNGRCRQTYANIRIDSNYKCRSCGLCGDFVTGKNTNGGKQSLRSCDGSDIEFGSGSDPSTTPEAFDPYGWTYERNYWLDICDAYDITDINQFQYLSPCDDINEEFQAAIKTECTNRAHVWADCCREVSEECVNMQKDCIWDTCVMSTVDGYGDFDLIPDAAIEAFDNAMTGLCSLPLSIYDPYYVEPHDANCGNEWEQCGGKDFKGEKCCKTGFKCTYDNEWYSQCREDASQSTGCASSWQQCGGKNHHGATCCNSGYVCIYDNEWYSQCKPVNNAGNEPNNLDIINAKQGSEMYRYIPYIMVAGIITIIFNLIAYSITYQCCLNDNNNNVNLQKKAFK